MPKRRSKSKFSKLEIVSWGTAIPFAPPLKNFAHGFCQEIYASVQRNSRWPQQAHACRRHPTLSQRPRQRISLRCVYFAPEAARMCLWHPVLVKRFLPFSKRVTSNGRKSLGRSAACGVANSASSGIMRNPCRLKRGAIPPGVVTPALAPASRSAYRHHSMQATVSLVCHCP